LKVPAGDKKLGPYECDPGKVCTNFKDDVCVLKSELNTDIRNICGDGNGACGGCTADQLFTCASRTQGARCVSGQMSTSVIFDCEKDEICISDAEKPFGTVCVPKCAADFVSIRLIKLPT